MTSRTAPVKINRRAFEAMWHDPAKTTDEIAAAFGLHRSSVTPLGYRLGLSPRKSGPKPRLDEAMFRALWAAKVTTAEIGRVMGVARNYPGVVAKRLGLPKRPQGMRGSITLADFRALQLRDALSARAREEQAALLNAEMVDDARAMRRRAA